MKEEYQFDSYLKNRCEGSKRNFTIEETNSSKTLVYDQKKKRGAFWRNRLSDGEMKNLWIFRQVKSSLIKYAYDNKGFKIYEKVPSIKYNYDKINNLQVGDEFLATDAKHCYWRVGYLLKYFSQKLYDRLAVKEYKLERNKAMACVCSAKKIHIYKKGKFIRTDLEHSTELRLLYNNIRNRAHYIISHVAKITGKGFIKYKIDCVYYHPKYKEKVESEFKKYNMLFETTECTYIGERMFIEHHPSGNRHGKL